jgi:hypothetical protein
MITLVEKKTVEIVCNLEIDEVQELGLRRKMIEKRSHN